MAWTGLRADELDAIAVAAPPIAGSARAAAVGELDKRAACVTVADAPPESTGLDIATSSDAWFADAGRLLLDAVTSADAGSVLVLQALFRRVFAQLRSDEEQSLRTTGADTANIARAERRGRLLQLVEFSRAGQEHLLAGEAVVRMEPGGQLEQFLIVVGDHPGSSSREIASRITDRNGDPLTEPVISRLGRKALGQGLVDVVRTGRRNSWELTARGQKTWLGIRDRAHRPVSPVVVLDDAHIREVVHEWTLNLDVHGALTRAQQADQLETGTVAGRAGRRINGQQVIQGLRDFGLHPRVTWQYCERPTSMTVHVATSDDDVAPTGRLELWDGHAWNAFQEDENGNLAAEARPAEPDQVQIRVVDFLR